jgi:hypothetical protein
VSREERKEERKERVLHARIPAVLDEQIKKLAEGLRVPVSNLVRNVLEDALVMTRRIGASPAEGLTDIYGWQGLVLNVETPCARCGAPLEPGDQAYVGLTVAARDPRHFICPACLPRPRKGH